MPSRLPPRYDDEVLARDWPEIVAYFQRRQAEAGYVANAMRIMAQRPDILEPFLRLLDATYWSEGEVGRELKTLLALVRSGAAGCRYCQAHTASRGYKGAVDEAKMEAVWDFETSPLFSEAERAALRLARDAAVQPNAVTDQHFSDLLRHFTVTQAVEILAVISLFAFLNCWNDSLATELEEVPFDTASRHLADRGWSPDKHI
jgi:uncharacterized peroxidase-related enzyme